MLDLRFVRENLDEVAAATASQHASFDKESFASLDEERRRAIVKEEALQAERNTLSKQIGQLMGQKKMEEAEAVKARVAEIKEELPQATAEREAIEAAEETDQE